MPLSIIDAEIPYCDLPMCLGVLPCIPLIHAPFVGLIELYVLGDEEHLDKSAAIVGHLLATVVLPFATQELHKDPKLHFSIWIYRVFNTPEDQQL